MNQLLALGVVFISSFSVGADDDCCQQKQVGEYLYNYKGMEDTSEYKCLSDCTYHRVGDPNTLYCFAAGHMHTVCEVEGGGEGGVGGGVGGGSEVEGGGEGGGEDSPRVRKNLFTLNDTEMHDLLYALIEAKQSGTYKGPPISGQAETNSSYFNSAYNAATSFHGYPGLCGSPNPNDPDDGACCIHGYSTFLPWHRLFMVHLEDALRYNKTYKHVTLPYWDWTLPFNELPPLVSTATIKDPTNPSVVLPNPFYHSWMPGKPQGPGYTKRSPYELINYNNHTCLETSHGACQEPTQNFTDSSVLMDLVLTAFEETQYESFETQIEWPHNMFHNQLGFTPNNTACFHNDTIAPTTDTSNDAGCYPYTMQNTYYSSYDPIFMIFHTMVDYQWAVFQALQDHRGFPYPNDCHPGFEGELEPFNTDFNSNDVTKSHSRGNETIDYKQSFNYTYDKLTLNGMEIPELNTFLEKRNKKDRLFAGFSLPNMRIKKITYKLCYPNDTTCSNPSPHLTIAKLHKNLNAMPGVYTDSILLYVEVTNYLPQMGLKPYQDISFKIISSSIPANVTFTPVSIFRKADTPKDRITVNWYENQTKYNYAPFFKVRQDGNSSLRFLLQNGSQSVYQYNDKEAFQTCNKNNRTLVHQEIEIKANEKYYFQNPLKMECEEQNKLEVTMSNPCPWGDLVREKNGNASIGWQLDMGKYSEGICMEKGTFLTFYWRRDYHWVKRLTTKTDFDSCTNVDWDQKSGLSAPNKTTYPLSGGFQENVYYLVCPVGNGAHCSQGMKLKIDVKSKCDG